MLGCCEGSAHQGVSFDRDPLCVWTDIYHNTRHVILHLIVYLLMGFAKPAMLQGTRFFSKNAIFGQFLASEASQNKEGEVPPPPPFHIKNFKIFTKSKHGHFWSSRRVRGVIFEGIYDVFCTCLNFYIKTCNFKNYQKITKKSISSWCLAVFGFRPLPQTSSSPGPF